MKTNREKYRNTDDAFAAWRKHREECKCDCEFDSWLNCPCDEDVEKAVKDVPRGLGVALAGLLAGSLVADAIKGHFKDEKKEKPEVDDEKIDDIECPLCHGKRGRIDGMIVNTFLCPDCGAIIGRDKSMPGRAELAEWLSQFNKKQD